MPFYRFNGLTVHVKLSGKGSKRPPAPCCAKLSTGERCCAISVLLCDWKLGDGSTCDAPLCDAHGVVIGPDKHLCPIHDRQRREAEPELF